MSEYKILLIVVTAVFLLMLVSAAISAESWRLEKDAGWKAVSGSGEDKYLLAVSEIKQLIYNGQPKKARAAFEKLKKDFPSVAGRDLDVFMKAEMLFAKGKFTKAVENYNKFLDEFPQSEFCEVALDREFAIATAFLSGQKIRVLGLFKISGFATGEKIMEKITDRAGDAPIAKKAALAVVEALEKRGDFTEAYDKWSQISSRWPTGQMGKDALLGMARCKHAVYRGPKYNATNLISAKSYYESFRQRYPQDANELGIDKKIAQINEQLAYKQFNVGSYYERTDSIEAAYFYYRMVVDNWPGTTAAKMAKERVNKRLEIEK